MRRKRTPTITERLAARVYKTARWQRLRKWILNRHPRCADPERVHRTPALAVDVDHKRPIVEAPELTWRVSNLQPLCKQCHNRKTRGEQTRRRRRGEGGQIS